MRKEKKRKEKKRKEMKRKEKKRKEKKRKEKKRQEKKKEERADRNRSPSTIARTGPFCYSRAWNLLTPIDSRNWQQDGQKICASRLMPSHMKITPYVATRDERIRCRGHWCFTQHNPGTNTAATRYREDFSEAVSKFRQAKKRSRHQW